MYNDSRTILHKLYQIPRELSVFVTFGFSDGSRNFRELFPVP